MTRKYRVHYTNQGKRRKTHAFPARKQAEDSATFLKWQGAKKVTIREVQA